MIVQNADLVTISGPSFEYDKWQSDLMKEMKENTHQIKFMFQLSS